MRLNKVEKIIVAVILLGVILVGGAFLFIVPTFSKMDKANKTREANIAEKQNLETELARLSTIDGEITEKKNDAVKFEGTFYPDLTTYESSEIAMALMKECGLNAYTIDLTDISTRDLNLEYYVPVDVEYSLKTFAQTAKNAGDDAEEVVLTEGQFLDGKKVYNIAVGSILDVTITDEEGNVIEPSRYSETMKKVYKAAICKFAQTNKTTQTVACTQATYEVTGKFSDYMKFIDYIYAQPRATGIATVTIPMTTNIESDKDEESPTYYIGEDGSVSTGDQAAKKAEQVIVEPDTEVTESVTLIFFSVEPMHSASSVDAGSTKVVVNQRPAVY